MEAQNIRLPDSIAVRGQLLFDHERHRLIIADTHQHRVAIANLAGQVPQVIGTGEAGYADGVCAESQFRHPREIAADSNFIYVADTGNHVILRVDRKTHQVTTIAESLTQGKQSYPHYESRFEEPVSLALAD